MEQLDLPRIGMLPAGELDSIGDVPSVTVGHFTLAQGARQTGVTVVRPHEGDPFRNKVPAAATVLNGFGKSCGLIQVEELGVLETPIALTNTFAVGAVVMRRSARPSEPIPRSGAPGLRSTRWCSSATTAT